MEFYPTFIEKKQMCGRFSFALEDALIHERFGVSVRSAIYKARYNCAPSQALAVITNDARYDLQFFRWGLVPSWARDATIGARMINAKAETIAEKPSFKHAFRARRCLVPADGFYEWKKNGSAIPYRILLNDGGAFAMAGIWERWESPGGEVVHSFSVITTHPNTLMAPIHNRMPVILLPEEEQRWLTESDPTALMAMLKPYPSDHMRVYKISTLVNSPKNDNPQIWSPVE